MDEVNLLDDGIVDVVLDWGAFGFLDCWGLSVSYNFWVSCNAFCVGSLEGLVHLRASRSRNAGQCPFIAQSPRALHLSWKPFVVEMSLSDDVEAHGS